MQIRPEINKSDWRALGTSQTKYVRRHAARISQFRLRHSTAERSIGERWLKKEGSENDNLRQGTLLLSPSYSTERSCTVLRILPISRFTDHICYQDQSI
jgi:hypothetical protein